MAGIFPTQIAQINDYSGYAGGRVIDALKDQAKGNVYADLAGLVGKATQAVDSEKLGNAVNLFTQAMEGGKTAAQAREGLDSRMLGSKAFQDSAGKTRDSILKQKTDDRAAAIQADIFRRQSLADKEKSLGDSLAEWKLKFPGMERTWYENNKKDIDAIPGASSKFLGQMGGALFTDPTPATGPSVDYTAADAKGYYADMVRGVAENNNSLSTINLKMQDSREERQKLKDSLIKQMGYSGTQAESANGQIDKYLESALAVSKKMGLPDDVAYKAVQENLTKSWLNWVPGWREPVAFNEDNARQALENINVNDFYKQQATLERQANTRDLLGKALEGQVIEKASVSYANEVKAAQALYASGQMSTAQYQRELQNAGIKRDLALADLTLAIKNARLDKIGFEADRAARVKKYNLPE